jgi:large repetitive protein
VLKNTKPLLAKDENATGRVQGDQNLHRILLVLAPTAQQEAELQKLIDDQHDRRSPSYHHWLSAAEFGARYGAASSDLEQIRTWLEGAGLRVDGFASSRRWLEFSGTAAQVESVFHTKMQYYQVRGKTYMANATDLTVPASLSGITRGVFSLNNFGRRPPVRTFKGVAGIDAQGRKVLLPQLTATGGAANTYYVAPGDFATIYGTKGLLSGGVDGSGVAIAIAAQSQIQLTDVQQFRMIFGLKTNDPNFLISGPDPGIASQLDAEEALLDVEWAGAVAPGATVNLVVAASTDTTSGVDLAAAYAIDNQVAPILTYTYGSCEQALTSTGNAFYNALWQQAAAEGITVLVASGDNGAAGGDNPDAGIPAQLGPAVNGVASTPYNVAVGGTEFDDGSQPTPYWNSGNAADYSSAIGYIPEKVWNESCDPSQTGTSTNCAFGNTTLNLLASGGGASTVYSKPAWQSGTGVPADSERDVPDIALAAASAHDDIVYCTSLGGIACEINAQQQVVGLTLVGGTSAATPAMAGILALIEQKNGAYQGQIDYTLYRLAATAANVCNSSQETNPAAQNSCVFYDVTAGNNDVPCAGGSPGCSSATNGTNGILAGSNAGIGYDLVTGLGSINATNLANAWSSATFAPSQTTLQASSLSVTHGTPITLSGSVSGATASSPPTGLVSIKTDAFGDSTQTLTLSSGGTFSGAISDLPGGQYNVLAHYAGDGTFAASDSSVLPVTIASEDSATNLVATGLASSSAGYGAPVQLKVTVAGVSGQGIASGAIELQDNNSIVTTSALGPDGSAYILTGGGASYAFGPGAHSLTASYSGNNSFHSSSSAPLAFTIDKGTPFVVVGVNSQSVPAGGTVGAHAIVSGAGTAAATGTVQFTCDGIPCSAPVTLETGGLFGSQAQASALLTGLTPGTHVIGAIYNGSADPNYTSVMAGDTTNELTQTVTLGSNAGSATTTSLVVGPTPTNLGDTGTFLVTVAPKTASGTVTIWDAVGPRSAATAISSGSASIQFAWTQAGTTSVYAVYSGDATNGSSTSTPTTFTVQKGAPQIALTGPATASANQQVSLNTTVVGNPTNPQLPFPTGSVEIWDSLNGGAAQLLTSQHLTAGPGGSSVYGARLMFAPGAHTVFARYRGDTNWQTKDSGTIQLSSSAFTVSVTSITMSAGRPGSGTVTITPSGGFTGTVALTCATGTSSLPAGYTCAFASPNVTVSTGVATTTVTLTPTAPAAAAVQIARASGNPLTLLSMSLAAGLLLIGFGTIVFGPVNNGRNFALFGGFVILAAGLAYGCGGGGGGGGGGPFSTTTSLTSSSPKAGFGAPVTFTAKVTPSGAATPSGTVELFDNGQTPGSPVRVNAGIVSFLAASLPVGVHSMTAQYSGDSNTLGSTSPAISQAITGQGIVEITGTSNGITETSDFTVVVN